MLSLQQISLGFGGPLLLDKADLQINKGDRACLVGRNGTGKSSLLKLLAGEYPPDSGKVQWNPGTRLAYLPQDTAELADASAEEILTADLASDHLPDWEIDARVDKTLRQLQLDPETRVKTLSTGMQRRILLGRCLVHEPDLLLLDEPTNHLDLEAIQWMESFLPRFPGAILFTTHDRTFLQRVATRIVDLERGQLTAWDCDYETYLVRKEAWLADEAVRAAAFDKKLAKEEAWIRQGIKARRTRNEGRVRALQKLRRERAARRERTGDVRLEISEADRSGVKVIAAEGVHFSYGDKALLNDFSLLLSRGDRVGIVGPNGAGKTTLLKVLLGELKPQSGSVVHGTNLQIAYFDQNREQLNPEASVADNVMDGAEMLDIGGKRRHVISYLEDFLFPPGRARSPVKSLSGGEKNRLLLARLFTRPFNLLVLDEPTNDLDLETLELLEERLLDFNGTLLTVSHDRAFLDHIATALLIIEPDGNILFWEGDYESYLQKRKSKTPTEGAAVQSQTPIVSDSKTPIGSEPETPTDRVPQKGKPVRPRKFLNRERDELERLPSEIEALEEEMKTLAASLADSTLYSGDNRDKLSALQARTSIIEKELQTKYDRWTELEDLRAALE